MSGAFSVNHIPKAKPAHYEMESEVNQLAMRHQLHGANIDGGPNVKWLDLSLQKAWSVDLILYRYPKTDRDSQDRASRSIVSLEENRYFDTGRQYDS